MGNISDREILRIGSHNRLAVSVVELRAEHKSQTDGFKKAIVEVLNSNATLADAARTMFGRRNGALPITERRSLIGIITDTDLLRAIVADCETLG